MKRLLHNLALVLALSAVGCAGADIDDTETEGRQEDTLLLKPGLFGPDPCATVTPEPQLRRLHVRPLCR